MSSIPEQFAEYAVREQTASLAPELVHHAKRAVIDWFAALLPGSVIEPASLMEQALSDELDTGRAALASGRRASMRAAAFINGAASHAIEVDDIYRDATYHPGSPTVAAALAVSQARGASGEAFLRAVIVGYEISTRIGTTVVQGHYKYWHPTGTIGCFGATGAAATVLRLDRDQVAHALSTVTTFAAGLQQAFQTDSMTKPLHSAHAAQAGVTSALGAEKGLTGAWNILEGPVGFGVAMSKDPDWSSAVKGLGSDYNIMRTTLKNHCCCGLTFSALDAAIALRAAHQLKPEQIKRVTVHTFQAALDFTQKFEATPPQARLSFPYVISRALVDGSVRLAAFMPPALREETVLALMRRVEFKADPQMSARFPYERPATVEIETIDGRLLKHHQPHRKGDPECPLTDEELNDKYLELAAPIVGTAAAQALLKRLWALERSSNMDFSRDLRPQRAAVEA